jgi:hypothetical protein
LASRQAAIELDRLLQDADCHLVSVRDRQPLAVLTVDPCCRLTTQLAAVLIREDSLQSRSLLRIRTVVIATVKGIAFRATQVHSVAGRYGSETS